MKEKQKLTAGAGFASLILMRRAFLIFSIFLFWPFFACPPAGRASAAVGDISQIIFTNSPLTVKPDESALLTIQLQYSGDSHPTVCMEMFTDSNTGRFSSSDATWKDANKLTINSNWTNKNFYYKDSAVGNYTLTVKVMPVSCSVLSGEEAQWIISQGIVISDSSGEEDGVVQEESGGFSGPDQSEYIPPEELPRIKADAGKDRTMIAGALAEFRGEAFGLDDEPLDNARYLWNFGDGTLEEGQNVYHFYRYSGEYSAVLDVSSGEYSACDKMIVKVIPNNIFISEVKTGVDSFIEIQNKLKEEINISDWRLRAGLQTFTFSQNSFIRPNSFLVISISSSGILLSPGKGSAELLYPGGFLADSFVYDGILSPGQSFSRAENGSVITPETPGVENGKMVVLPVASSVQSFVPKMAVSVSAVGAESEQRAMAEPEDLQNEAFGESQEANVVVAADGQISGNKAVYYLFGILGLAVFSGAGVLLVRRQSRV